MKNIKYYVATLLALITMGSCNSLDIDNIYSYDANKVWNDENLAEAYVTNIYANVFGNWSPSADERSEQTEGIHWYKDRITIVNGEYKPWSYSTIRLVNEALVNLENGTIDEEIKKRLRGECLFIRAYLYYDMVQSYGGVPYITIPQDKDTDDLYVKRNSTKECFEFILADIDEAITLIDEKISSSSTMFGHIDGVFATAFKAKVLLRMASPQFNPSNPWNNAYWQQAHSINKAAYELAKKHGAALSATYGEIYMPERGSETIFSVINSYPNKTANWDNGIRPGSESRGNAWAPPAWEYVKNFPMADGKQYDDPTGKYTVTDEEMLQSFWMNRDPRFYKVIVTNGSIYEVSGKSGNRQYTAVGVAHELDDFGTNPNAGINSTNLNSASGFFVRKGSNLSLKQEEVQQFDTDHIVMRFAEVMLNYAETANETGDMAAAINILKEIRERAGIEPGDDGNYGMKVATREELRETILAERNIELCFEGHRYSDLRRLRMLDRLDGSIKHGVEAIAINADGTEMSMSEAIEKAGKNELTEADFKYILHQIPFSGVQINELPDTYYFYPIKQSTLDMNTNLEQNMDWGGTFNPVLEP